MALISVWLNKAEAAACPPPPFLFSAESGKEINSKGGNFQNNASVNKNAFALAGCGGSTTSTPGTPGTMSVPSTDNNGAFTVSWGASSNIQSPGYYVLYKSLNGGAYTTVSSPSYNSTSQSVSGLSDGSYTFRIRGCNVDLTSGAEKCSGYRTSSATTVRNLPSTPVKPSDVKSTSTSYTVSWSKPSGTVTYYDVQEKVGSGSWVTVSSGQTGTSLWRSGKANNTTYYYRVRACNGYYWSCSGYSSQNTVWVELKPSAPSAPANVQSTSTSYTVSWSKPSGTVSYYNVQERVSGGSWSTIATNYASTSISRSGRSNNTTYQYRVQACNSYSWACSSYSSNNNAYVRLKPSTPGAANPTSSTSTGNVTVSWSAVSGATYYNVQRRNNSGSWSTAATGISGTSTSLSGFSSGSWDFRIQACNAYSWSCSAYGVDGSQVTWRSIPGVPGAANPSTTNDTDNVTVSWSGVAGATYYNVQRRLNSGSWQTAATSVSGTSTTLTSGFSDGLWTFRVQACNGYSWACSSYGASGSQVSWRQKPATPAGPNPTTSVDTNDVTVSWSAVSGASYYNLQQRKDSGIWTTVGTSHSSTSKTFSSSDLSDGSWTFRLQACNAFSWACSAYSAAGSAVTWRAIPAIPGAVNPTTSTDTNDVTVSWSAVSGATYYNIQRRNNSGSWLIVASSVTGTSQSLSDFTDGSWDFRIQACNGHGWACSSYGAAGSAVVWRAIPAIPATANPTTTTDTDSVTISWTAVSGATYYNIQRRNNGGSWSTTASSVTGTSKALSSFTEGNWDFRIQACNGYSWACSGYGAAGSAVVWLPIPSIPAAPTLPSNDGNGSYTISWVKPAGKVTFYSLQERKNNSGSWVTIASNTGLTYLAVTGRGDGAYDYRVRACNVEDWACSAYSAVSADINVLNLPGVPASISNPATDADGSISVSWGSATGQVDEYRLEEQKDGGAWTQIAAENSAIKAIHSLTDGSYLYRVRACNATGCGGYRTGTAATIIHLKPSTPAAPTGPATSTGVATVSWAGVARATYYDVEARNNGGSWSVVAGNVTATSYTFPSASDGNWEARVRACNTENWSCSGYSDVSALILVRNLPSIPAMPTLSTTQSTSGSYSVSWSKPSGAVTYYDLRERKNNTGSFTTVADNTNATTASLSGRGSGLYDYHVRACNEYDWACSNYSSITGDVEVRIIPGVPSLTAPTSSNSNSGKFTLGWSSASEATFYQVQQRLDNGSWSTIADNQTGTSYAVEVNADGTYDYQVKACNTGTWSCSAYSATKSMTVALAPDYATSDPVIVPDADLVTPIVPANQAVGALQGQAGVSGGAATYTVPIVIPPGRAGMQPRVSLNYSSRGGNGIAGVGWNLGAGSSIHRCGKTAAQDGFSFGVTYSAIEDRLCLDGQRLMVVSGSYGVSGAEYRTELDTFAKVVQSGGINSTSSQFSVYHKNGNISHYGGGSASQSAEGRSEILTWAIRKKEDRSQNSIDYNYSDKGNGEFVLASIDYTGHASSVGNRQVKFNYVNLDRDDQSFSYLQGGLTAKTQLLESITTHLDVAQIREYKLAYSTSSSTERNVLESITECATDSQGMEVCLPATNFSTFTPNIAWKSVDSGDANQTAIANFGELDENDQVLTKDLNGDGIAEALYLEQKEDGSYDVRVYVLNSAGAYEEKTTADLKGNDFHVYAGIQGDINGDGITDFISNIDNQLVYFQFDQYFELHQHNSGFYFSANYDRINSGKGVQVTDINGDGYADIFFGNLGINGDVEAAYYQNKADGNVDFSGPYTLVDMLEGVVSAGGRDEYSFLNDFDGDGILDIALTYNAQPTSVGVAIAFGSRTNGTISATRFSAASLGLPTQNAFNQFTWADLNGDGLKDFVRAVERSNNTFEWAVRINTGNRSFGPEQYLGTNKSIHKHRLSGHLPNEFFYKVQAKFGGLQVADFDSDGKEELLVATHSDDNYGIRIVGWEHNSSGNIADMWEACIDNDDIHNPEFYTKSCAGETQGEKLNSSLGSYDFRRFHWSIVDFKQVGSQISHSRDINDVAYAPLTGFVPLNGQRVTQLVTKDYNNDGYLDFTYTTAASLSLRSSQEGNVIRYVSVGGRLLDGAIAGTFATSTNKPVNGYFAQQNNASLVDEGSGNYSYANKEQDTLYLAENGLGFKSEWDFAPISRTDLVNGKKLYSVPEDRESWYTNKDLKREHFYFTSSMPVTTNFRQSDGIGGTSESTYRYKEAVYNRKGRGFQGFRTVIVESPDNMQSVSDFHQVFPLAGKLEQVRTCLVSDNDDTCLNKVNPLFRVRNDYLVTKNYDASDSQDVYWVTNAKTITKKRSLVDRAILYRKVSYLGESVPYQLNEDQWLVDVDSSAYDEYGNILKSSIEQLNGFSHIKSVTTNNYYLAIEEDWWVNKLESTVVSAQTLSNTSAVYDATLDPVKSTTTTIESYDIKGSRQPAKVTTSATDAKSITVETVYSDYGLTTKATTSSDGETSRVVDTGYSSDGYFIEWVDGGLGRTYSSINPIHGQPDSQIDLNGLVTNYLYDAFNRGEKVEPPAGSGQPVETRFALCNQDCDNHGFLADVESRIVSKQTSYQAGAPESVVYKDMQDRVVATATKAFDGSNFIFTTEVYDALGRKVRETFPSHNAAFDKGTHFDSYDAIGRITQKRVDQAMGQSMTVTYNYTGHQTSITANNLSMSRTHSGNGQLLQTVDANFSVTQYAYDAAGHPIVLADANGNAITAKYNSLGQKLWVNDPNMGNKTFTYTGFGEVESEKDANGNTYAYQYDDQGRIYERLLNGTREAYFEFDTALQGESGTCNGLPASEEINDSSSFKRTYVYDSLCRPVQNITTIDSENFVLTTHYDVNYGRIKGTTYPTGITLENWYNSDGYLTHQVNASSDYVFHEVTQVDARGQVLNALKANGILTESRNYDDVSGQMTLVHTHASNGGSQRHRIAYTDYDNFGNLKTQQVETTQQDGSVLTTTETYGYDDLHRLIWSNLDGTQINYEYDKVGNLTKKDDYAASYVYGEISRSNGNAGPNAVRQITKASGGTISYSYDSNGNLTSSDGPLSDDDKVISYNAFNKPLSISRKGIVSNFSYASDQMRYKQVKNGKAGGVETTLYIGKEYEEIRYNGKTIKKSYLGDTIVTETTDNQLTQFDVGFVHRDRLESVVTITDENGNVVDNKSYDPFGKPRKANMQKVDPDDPARLDEIAYIQDYLSQVESTELHTRRGFTDHEHLDDAELIHMNGRIYDYQIGRFLSVDPFIQEPGNSQSMNPYSYIMNNPLSGSDPSGYFFEADGTGMIDACLVSFTACGLGTTVPKHEGPRVAAINFSGAGFFGVDNGFGFLSRFINSSKSLIEDIGSQVEVIQASIPSFESLKNSSIKELDKIKEALAKLKIENPTKVINDLINKATGTTGQLSLFISAANYTPENKLFNWFLVVSGKSSDLVTGTMEAGKKTLGLRISDDKINDVRSKMRNALFKVSSNYLSKLDGFLEKAGPALTVVGWVSDTVDIVTSSVSGSKGLEYTWKTAGAITSLGMAAFDAGVKRNLIVGGFFEGSNYLAKKNGEIYKKYYEYMSERLPNMSDKEKIRFINGALMFSGPKF